MEMDFHFSQEEQNLLDQIHDFAVRDVAPLAAELDWAEEKPNTPPPKFSIAASKLKRVRVLGS